MDKDISVTLKVWRQRGPKEKGQFETYKIEKINQNRWRSTTTAVRVSVACVHCM